MVTIASNGDLIVQQKNLPACQYIEYYAICVKQYCKETMNRDKRLYDLRGVVISTMANDLKEFVKVHLARGSKKKNYNNHISMSMIQNVVEALEIFGDLYDSVSSKNCAKMLRDNYPEVFVYGEIVNTVITTLKKNNFVVSQRKSASTSSVYLDIDYKTLMSVRISDHYRQDWEGIQIIFGKIKDEHTGSNSIYFVREDQIKHDLPKVVSFVKTTLCYYKNIIARKKYEEYISNQKASYKEENSEYKEVG